MVYTLLYPPSKCSLFHNSNVFGSCIIRILCTGCAKTKKNNSGSKRLKFRFGLCEHNNVGTGTLKECQNGRWHKNRSCQDAGKEETQELERGSKSVTYWHRKEWKVIGLIQKKEYWESEDNNDLNKLIPGVLRSP